MSRLVLVPTPIAEGHPLEPVAHEALMKSCLDPQVILLVEEHKVARNRWLKWGLPREAIEKFLLFNEHTSATLAPELLKELKSGKTIFLLSDCGLPAFCDPGENLVDLCHRNRIPVTATPFPNSIALGLALSGFSHHRFIFSGFVPVKSPDRDIWLKNELKRSETQIWMETPYRLQKLLQEISKLDSKRELFLAIDLGSQEELLLRGKAHSLEKEVEALGKREFVLVLAPLSDTSK